MSRIVCILIIYIAAITNYAQAIEANYTIIIKLSQEANTKNTLTKITKLVYGNSTKALQMPNPLFPTHQNTRLKNGSFSPLASIYTMVIPQHIHLEQIIFNIENISGVVYAEPDSKIELLEIPNDPKISSQYYLWLIKAFDAFELTKGDTNIVIGIVDTGIDFYHEDLIDNIKFNYNDPINGIDDDKDGYVDNFKGWDLSQNDNDPQCETNPDIEGAFHGTYVSGLASATTNNGVGIASAGYLTKILPVKIMDSVGSLAMSYQGIVYAADQGCQIINCSWGSTSPSLLGADVIDYVVNDKNCLVIAAAGNAGNNIPWYPASLKNVLSVAATNASDLKWTKSTFGIEVDVCAPGERVLLTSQNNSYINGSGTSFAAPIVAGAAALLKAYHPELNALQLGEQLRITSDIIDTIGDNQYFYHQMGYGRINLLNALTITNMPSVRIENMELATNQNIALLRGDTLSVSFSAVNYLWQVTNTIIRVTSNSEFLTPLKNLVNTNALATLDEAYYEPNSVQFLINETIPPDHHALLTFEMNDVGYNDYQSFKILINKSFIDVSPNKITTTLTSNGKIGYANRSAKNGKGFIYNNSVNLLNDAGIIIANSIDYMSSALFNKYEFNTTQLIDTTHDVNSTLHGITQLSSQELTQIKINVKQHTVGFSDPKLGGSILHEYTLTNFSDEVYNQLRMALYTDWDIINSKANETSFDETLNLFYTFTHTDRMVYAGICLLNEKTGTPYGFDLISGGNGGMDITLWYSNEQKWFTMNTARAKAGNDGDSINVATMLTAGPFVLNPTDSLKISFALIAANNLYELKQQALALREKYLTQIENPVSLNPDLLIYPNPGNRVIYLENNTNQFNKAIFYNSAGALIKTVPLLNHTTTVDVQDLKPGIYLIRFTSKNKISSKKLIILP